MMDIIKNFNWIDVLVVLLLLKSAYAGARTGLTAELFKLIGTVISIVLGLHYYNNIGGALIDYINMPVWFAQFIILVVVVLLVRVIFKYGVVLLLKVLNIQFILGLERIGGALIGFGRGFLFGGLILIASLFLPVRYFYSSIYEGSFLASYLIRTTKAVYTSIIGLVPSQEAREITITPLKKQTKSRPH